MMKKLSFLLIAILTSIISFAQEPKEVLIPVKALDGIIEDLTRYEGLKITLLRKDSVITVLKQGLEKKDSIILTHKLKVGEYTQMNKNLDDLLLIKEAQNKDLKKEVKKVKLRNTLIIIGEAIVIILLVL